MTDPLASILVVDDDARVGRTLSRYLGANGYEVQIAMNGDEMFKSIENRRPDLVLLDLQLPGTHGLELARELRKDADIGIIIVTGSGEPIDKVVGLELGADDYIAKPYEERELLARVRTVLRRVQREGQPTQTSDHSVATFLDWRLDLTAHTLTNPEGQDVALTSHEFQIMTLFVQNANKVLSRDQIMDRISGRGWIPMDRSVDVLVSKIRRKLEDDSHNPKLIKTIRGAGYILTTHVAFS